MPTPIECKPGQGRRWRRGGALLAVLWLVAALSAIAFSVATAVRSEFERAAASFEGLQCEYLAAGAIDRAILYMLWGPVIRNPDGSPKYWQPGSPRLYFQFPAGEVVVEIVPATAMMNPNTAAPEELARLLVILGQPPEVARRIAETIVRWRSPAPEGGLAGYLSSSSSFPPRHASFEETEELLLVPGVTPELYYGTYVRDEDGRLVRRSGLRDCLSVYGSNGPYDVNTADPAVLLAAGVPQPVVEEIVALRQQGPIVPGPVLARLQRMAGPAGSRLGVGGRSIYTLYATARVRLPNGSLSDTRRTVGATVKFFGWEVQPPYHILRWYPLAAREGLRWPS